MDPTLCNEASMLGLPLELITAVCQQLDPRALVRFAATCKRFRYGEDGLETAELPTKLPVVTALREHAFSRPTLIPSTRPAGCSESWVAYLARCARQRSCREELPIAAGRLHSLFLDSTGRLLAGGDGVAVGHGYANAFYSNPTPVAALAGVRVRSVAAGCNHSLALGWDGRVYSWGKNWDGQLGHGDKLDRPSPVLVEGLEGVCSIAADSRYSVHSFAVTQSGDVFTCGRVSRTERDFRPTIVEGFEGLRMRRVFGGLSGFAIGEAGELFSWGSGSYGVLGHGDTQYQPSPKRVEAMRGVPVSMVSVGAWHVLALAEDGLVYAWGENTARSVLGNPHVERELLPKPIEALSGVLVSNIAAGQRNYAVADTGELWAWGEAGRLDSAPLGHGELVHCFLPKPIAALRGVKTIAVAANKNHTLALADGGGVYAWGSRDAARCGALGSAARKLFVPAPRRIPALRVACGL
jgi:alpha-tubulin suppressor-like RCC1 family protein